MAAAALDIKVDQGSDFIMVVPLKNADGTAMDLTGVTFKGQVRRNYSSKVVLADFSFEIPTPTNGEFHAKLERSVTSKLPVEQAIDFNKIVSKYVYDIEMTDTSGRVTRILEGVAFVSPEVTR